MTFVTGDTTTTLPSPDGPHAGTPKPSGQPKMEGPQRQALSRPAADHWSVMSAPRPQADDMTPPAASGTGNRHGNWRPEPPAVPGPQHRDLTSGDNASVVNHNGQSVRTVEEPLPQNQVQSFIPTEHRPLADMETEDAARYFQHLDTAFADIDAHRGVMHGPMQWPQPDTAAGQERVEGLISKLFRPKERPESAYTTLILYMPSPGDPKRVEKVAGFATAVSRQLRTMVEQGALPLATATVLHQSLARHAAAGSHPRDAQSITRMFERKRLEVVSISASPR